MLLVSPRAGGPEYYARKDLCKYRHIGQCPGNCLSNHLSSLAFIKVCDGVPVWGEGGLLQEPQGLVSAGEWSWVSNPGTMLLSLRGSIA
eukprot:10535179-Heterocapsa_arctica.AAC.1